MVRRGFGFLVEGGSSPFHFGDDLVGGLVPDEGFGVVVPVFDPQVDGVDEFVDGAERVAAETPGGDFAEPAFHQD